IGSLTSSYGTSAGDPQNSQFCATRVGSNTITAWQLWHWTLRFSACQPRSESGSSRSVLTRSISSIWPLWGLIWSGDSVPQNGRRGLCWGGVHGAGGPRGGHGNFARAATWGGVAAGDGGAPSGVDKRPPQLARYLSSAARVTRKLVPIFFAPSSPDWMIAIT